MFNFKFKLKFGQGREILRRQENLKKVLDKLDLKNGPWIAGGAALSFYQFGHFDKARDLDIYFKDQKSFYEMKSHINSLAPKIILDDSEEGIFKVSSYSADNNGYSGTNWIYRYSGYEFNLIEFIKFNSPIDCLNNFDFTICQFATDGKDIIYTEPALEAYNQKKIEFVNYNELIQRYSWTRIEQRLQKYQDKGYIPGEEVLFRRLAN